jgi:O-methyltransferase involved in polyketide biosynthesis
MDDEKVHLTSEHETYLSTLYGKALDNRVEDPILGDTFADEAVKRIDFDFKKLKLPDGGEITLPIRAKHLDGWTREFLAANPESTVLHLGCGLDSRVYRIDPPATVHWYDVDKPDVIELRRRLYPERHDYEMIGASVTDPGWLEGIPSDKPVIVVAEGMVQYLTEEDGVTLFNRITEKFPSGQIVFDAYNGLMVGIINLAARFGPGDVHLPWGINDPRALEKQVARLELVDAVPFFTIPELLARLARTRAQKMYFGVTSKVAFLRNAIRHLRYRF